MTKEFIIKVYWLFITCIRKRYKAKRAHYMDKFFYSAGAIILILSLVTQYVKVNLPKLPGLREEKRPFFDEVALLILIGIILLILGGVMTLTKGWLESSPWGIVVAPLSGFSLVFLFKIILWLWDKHQRD